MMESRSSFYDLANAPPLLNDSEMEVTMTGEKRKTTPPDLLTLSHMYFEKNQVLLLHNSYSSSFILYVLERNNNVATWPFSTFWLLK